MVEVACCYTVDLLEVEVVDLVVVVVCRTAHLQLEEYRMDSVEADHLRHLVVGIFAVVAVGAVAVVEVHRPMLVGVVVAAVVEREVVGLVVVAVQAAGQQLHYLLMFFAE